MLKNEVSTRCKNENDIGTIVPTQIDKNAR